jgi:hypothetical protein
LFWNDSERQYGSRPKIHLYPLPPRSSARGNPLPFRNFLTNWAHSWGRYLICHFAFEKGNGRLSCVYDLLCRTWRPGGSDVAFSFPCQKKISQSENFDVSKLAEDKLRLQPSFILYMAGISLLALGFADFPLITMHIARESLVPSDTLPLLYAAAMLVDAFAALFFGWMYDKRGIRVLMLASAISASFPFSYSAFILCPPQSWESLCGESEWARRNPS